MRRDDFPVLLAGKIDPAGNTQACGPAAPARLSRFASRLARESRPMRASILAATTQPIPARCARRGTGTRQAGARAVVPDARFHVPHLGRFALQSRPVAGCAWREANMPRQPRRASINGCLPALRAGPLHLSLSRRPCGVPAVTSCLQRATPPGIAPPSPL